MSAEDVKQIIGRAILDAEFRELLFGDPEAALKDYALTDEELVGLKKIERENFDNMAVAFEERMSRAGIGLLSIGGRIKLNQRGVSELNQAMQEFDGLFLKVY